MLLLKIADINLLFKSDLKGLKIGYPHKDFIHSPSPQSSSPKGKGQGEGIDSTISIEEYPSPFNIKNKEIFSHTGPWKLYRIRNGYKIAFFSPLSPNDYYMIAELNKDFSRGRLYIRETRKKTFIISHPLDQLLIINLLSRGRGLMVHSCCVNDSGRGFLYAGTSRSGKSTTARLWLKQTNPPESLNNPPIPPLLKGGKRGLRKTPPNLPLVRGGEGGVKGERGEIMTGVKVLSDDRIIIRQMDGKFYAYGTPWHGEVEICDPGRVEIEKIFFLKHSEKNYLKLLSPVDAATRMFVRCFPTFWDKEGIAFTLGFIDKVVKKVPCYEFGFMPDKSAVEFVRGL